MMLEQKVVIVSGVGPGLGQELAYTAAREGASVVLAARSEDFLREVAAKVESQGHEALVVPTDITDAQHCQRLIDATVERFGRVDALINSAYTMGWIQPFETAEVEKWRVALKVNLLGTLQLSQLAVAPMKAQGGGSIVMIGTMAARKPMLNETGYAASKAALHAAARNMALELGPYGIRVNTVAMGWIWGPTAEGEVGRRAERLGITPAEYKAGLEAKTALHEIPTESDCANAAIFMASDLSRAISGAVLDVNAGEWMP
jgi:NAD(P)-dependent dehydrogenase (short-subunit alcohol dehydrogenase family)